MRNPKNTLIAGPRKGLSRFLQVLAYHARTRTPEPGPPASITYVTKEDSA